MSHDSFLLIITIEDIGWIVKLVNRYFFLRVDWKLVFGLSLTVKHVGYDGNIICRTCVGRIKQLSRASLKAGVRRRGEVNIDAMVLRDIVKVNTN